MLTKTEGSFALIFSILVVFELISGSTEALTQIHFFIKPAILISLIIFFWRQCGHLASKTRNLTLLALVFSLFGDVLLLFVDRSANFFMSGLVSFLLAHVMYILVFIMKRNTSKKATPFITILLLYALGLFYLLKDGLGGMLIPVLVYMSVILTMATTAFLRKGSVNNKSYILVFIGAILFMVSDSLLALNKFYMPLPFSNISIMLTYAIAQLFIVFGIKKQS